MGKLALGCAKSRAIAADKRDMHAVWERRFISREAQCETIVISAILVREDVTSKCRWRSPPAWLSRLWCAPMR
jgi:hypothetical protein